MLLLAAFPLLSRLGFDEAKYEAYRKFWGGNPAEIYSHWLDMLLMSGNAAMLAGLLAAEAFFRAKAPDTSSSVRLARACAAVGLVGSVVLGILLDRAHGEGTVILAFPLFFMPILLASYYLLRRAAAALRWEQLPVNAVAITYVALHVLAQLWYEPSDTGGPSARILPIWLGTVLVALGCAVVQGIRNGTLRRFCIRSVSFARKPLIWASAVAIILGFGIPLTIRASRLHASYEEVAVSWLGELEAKLTDEVIHQLQRKYSTERVGYRSRMPTPDALRGVLEDERIKNGHELRIFVPLNPTHFLFVWANDRFDYCDVRDYGNPIDRDFIDALIARGGTHQTGLYSVLWSPYIAGRVLKDRNGNVKAICVINSPRS